MTHQTFTQKLWQDNIQLFEYALAHPFNQQLVQGTLAQEAFQHFIIQDAHYLIAYGRALAVTAAKAFHADDIMQFSEGARVAIVVERSLHHDFMQQFAIEKSMFDNTPLSLACHHYTSFLTATAWSESYPVVLASLLPCFWTYAELGKAMIPLSKPNNPYQAWINTYAGDEFNQAVHNIIKTIDEVALQSDPNTLEKMKKAYRHAAQLEWLFWDSAYQQQHWPGLDHLNTKLTVK